MTDEGNVAPVDEEIEGAPEEGVSSEELEPLEVPEHWAEEEREHFARLAELENGRDIQQLWLDRYSNWDRGYNKKMQEVAEQRKAAEQLQSRFAPLQQSIEPYTRDLHAYGMQPEQAIPMALHWAVQYFNDPVQTIMELAQQDGFLQHLEEAITNQGYQDPHVSRLNQELADVKRQQMQAQQMQQQQAQQALFNAIREFESQTDGLGNPKYPHLATVWGDMQYAIQAGKVRGSDPQSTLAAAYEWALKRDDELWQTEQAKQAKAKARKEADKAAQAQEAGKRVRGKGGKTPEKKPPLRDALDKGLSAAGWE